MRNADRKGFTLVELLVVIAIIAILAGLVLPALMKSRRGALEAKCYSQLHEFNNGIHTYKVDYDKWYPYWLSYMYGSELGQQAELFICPLDDSRGKQGGRPDWIRGASQYAETNDMDPTLPLDDENAFTNIDLKAAPEGYLHSYYERFDITERPTEAVRNRNVKRCSYLYEYTREYCSWYNYDDYDMDGDGLTNLTNPWDEVTPHPSALSECAPRTWQDVKLVEEIGNTLNKDDNSRVLGSLVPIIRCFHHIEDTGDGELYDDKVEHQHVVNLRVSGAVNKSPPKKWWVQNE